MGAALVVNLPISLTNPRTWHRVKTETGVDVEEMWRLQVDVRGPSNPQLEGPRP